MTSEQNVGWILNNTSAITAIVSNRIYSGLRPGGTIVPSINYFSIDDNVYSGINSEVFSLNCRASSISVSKSLAKKVMHVFIGTSETGMYGVNNNFTVARMSLNSPLRTIPEPDDGIYNTPVDIRFVYFSDQET
jgi:hypothetical protein